MAFQQLRHILRFSAAVVLAIVACATLGYADPPAKSADSPAVGETKPWRPQIYDEKADGKELIAAALKRAKLEGKHVLIEWGGNWSGFVDRPHYQLGTGLKITDVRSRFEEGKPYFAA